MKNNSAFNLINTSDSSNIYLANATMKDGKVAWYYILVDKIKVPMFLEQIEKRFY